MDVGFSDSNSRWGYHVRRSPAKGLVALLLAGSALAAGGCTGSRIAAAATTPGPGAPASGGAAPIPFPALRPFYVPGETLTWEITMASITGGRARLAVSKPTPAEGRNVIVLRAEAESAGIAVLIKEVRSSISSWIDAESGVPARTESGSFGIGNTLVVHAARRTDENGDPLVDLKLMKGQDSSDSRDSTRRLPVVETHDPLSATLALRAWNAPTGTRALLYSLGGVRLWKTTLLCAGSEELQTAVGKRRALRIDGVSIRLKPDFDEDRSRPPRTFSLWFSEDDQRIPLKIVAHTELGDVTARVTSYHDTAPEP